MPYSTFAKNVMLTQLAATVTHLSIHTTTPNSSGSNEATGGSPAYARKVPAFGTPTGGTLPLSGGVTFDLAAGVYGYVGMWASTNWCGYGLLSTARTLTGQDVIIVSSFTPDLNL
jgi:hypothetical protein